MFERGVLGAWANFLLMGTVTSLPLLRPPPPQIWYMQDGPVLCALTNCFHPKEKGRERERERVPLSYSGPRSSSYNGGKFEIVGGRDRWPINCSVSLCDGSNCLIVRTILHCIPVHSPSRAGHFRYFFNNKKWFFSFFIKLVWLGVGFLNRTGAEIGYLFDKKMQWNHFLLLKKFKNTECAQLCLSVQCTKLYMCTCVHCIYIASLVLRKLSVLIEFRVYTVHCQCSSKPWFRCGCAMHITSTRWIAELRYAAR